MKDLKNLLSTEPKSLSETQLMLLEFNSNLRHQYLATHNIILFFNL